MSIDLDAIQARSKDHEPCTAEVCGSRVCQTARDRDALLAYARDLEARLGRVEALAEKWERTPALRRGTSATAIRAALTATEGAA